MCCSRGVFNLAVLIYKAFSITEFFQVAEWRAVDMSAMLY